MQKYMLSLKAQNELAFFNNGLLFEINNTTHHEY